MARSVLLLPLLQRGFLPNSQDSGLITFNYSGNTDCKMYYDLTKNVYRFTGSSITGAKNAVSVRP